MNELWTQPKSWIHGTNLRKNGKSLGHLYFIGEDESGVWQGYRIAYISWRTKQEHFYRIGNSYGYSTFVIDYLERYACNNRLALILPLSDTKQILRCTLEDFLLYCYHHTDEQTGEPQLHLDLKYWENIKQVRLEYFV